MGRTAADAVDLTANQNRIADAFADTDADADDTLLRTGSRGRGDARGSGGAGVSGGLYERFMSQRVVGSPRPSPKHTKHASKSKSGAPNQLQQGWGAASAATAAAQSRPGVAGGAPGLPGSSSSSSSFSSAPSSSSSSSSSSSARVAPPRRVPRAPGLSSVRAVKVRNG